MNSYVIRIGGRKSSGLLPAEITGGPGIKGRDLSMSDIPWWEELSQGTRPGSDKVKGPTAASPSQLLPSVILDKPLFPSQPQ